MAGLSLRWSEHEARKPYARPFGVSFIGGEGTSMGSIAVSGMDLLYYRQFQVAVLALAGELYHDPEVEADAEPQGRWLDRLGQLLPAAGALILRPVSLFDHDRGRVFRVTVEMAGRATPASLEPQSLLEYQELQAALAHQTGRLYRDVEVERIADPGRRQSSWIACLDGLLEHPTEAEAITTCWPWRVRAPSEP